MKQRDGVSGGRTAFSYAWVILFVIFIGQMASFGMRSSFGAYISPWEIEFSASRTLVTSISTLNFIIFAISQPFVGRLNDYLGKGIVPIVSIFLLGTSLLLASRANQIWQVYALFGVGFSIGVAGCRDSVSGGIITNWFIKRRGFAFGLAMVGSALGQLILAPANLFFIEKFGWRTAMASLSIIIMIVVGPLFIFLLRSKPEEKGLKPYGYEEPADDEAKVDDAASVTRKTLPVLSIFKLKAFWAIAIPYFVCGFTDVGIIQTHLVPMSEGKGISTAFIALAFSLIAILNIGGSLLTGHLSDRYSRKRQLAVIYACRSLSYVLLIFLQRPALLLLFAAIFGFVEMASVAPTHSLAVQLFDKYSVGAILVFIAVSHQMGGAAGSWVPGFLYDLTGSYTVVLALAIVLLLGGAWLAMQIPEPDRQITEKLKNK